MKKLFVTLAAVLVSVSTFGQGTVSFHNRPSTGDARITRPDGTGAGAGFTAQLFLDGSNTALTPTTTFRTTSAAAAFFLSPIDVTVPGAAPGTSATVYMRVWDSSVASWEAAVAANLMRSPDAAQRITIAALGGVNEQTGAIIPTPDLAGLTGFALVPEPSTIALGILGAAALLYRRRK